VALPAFHVDGDFPAKVRNLIELLLSKLRELACLPVGI
jgi:hypothetical protein